MTRPSRMLCKYSFPVMSMSVNRFTRISWKASDLVWMIAVLWAARNGPNAAPQDARTLAEHQEKALTQWRRSRGMKRIEASAFRFAASSRLFDSSGEAKRSRGVARDRHRPEGERCRARPPRCDFCVLGFCGRNSSERRVAAIFNIRVDPLGTRFGTEQRPVRSSTLSSCDRGRVVEGGRGLGSRS